MSLQSVREHLSRAVPDIEIIEFAVSTAAGPHWIDVCE